MAKFETPCQIVSLFVGAAGVAFLLIVFLNAEVRHRRVHEGSDDVDIVIEDAASVSHLNFYRSLLNRMSRQFRTSFGSESDVIEETTDSETVHVRNKRDTNNNDSEEKITANDNEDHYHQSLTESLITSTLSGHKVRNIKDKLLMISPDSQLVRSVLDLYCDSETVTYYMCYQPSNDTIENTTTTTTTSEHPPKNYSETVTNYVETMTKKLSSEDVEYSNIEQGICDYQNVIYITATITTIINLILFLIISMCRRPFKKNQWLRLIEEDKNDPILKNLTENISSPYEDI